MDEQLSVFAILNE